MKKLLIISFSACLFLACNNDKNQGGNGPGGNLNGGGGWSGAEKNKFMNDCTTNGIDRQVCNCILGKLQRQFKNMDEADRVGGEAAGKKFAMECQQGGGGNDWDDNGGGGNNDNWDDNNGGGGNNNFDENGGGNNWNDDDGGGGMGGWSKSDKNTFMKDCTGSGGNQQMCGCVLQQLQGKYKNLNDANRRGTNDAKRMAQQCLQQMQGGGGNGNDDFNDDNFNDNPY